MAKQLHKYREQWLDAGIVLLRNEVFLPVEQQLPKNLLVSCSFPDRGAFAKKTVLGQCWYPKKKGDAHQLLVSPTRNDPVNVLGTLAHECVHTIVGEKAGHKTPFKRTAVVIGLTGKMTSTIPGPDLKKKLEQFARALGPYPHISLLNYRQSKPKQGTRLIKASCPCGYVIRITQKWIDEVGLPDCPACETPLETEETEE